MSCGLFGYSFNLIGTVAASSPSPLTPPPEGEIINEGRREKMKLKVDMENLNSLMEDRNLSFELKHKVRGYFAYLHKERLENSQAGSEMINALPPSLKDEVMNDLYSKFLKKLPLFSSHFSEEFQNALSLLVREEKIGPELMILKKHTVPDKLYFILKGQVMLYWDPKRSSAIDVCPVHLYLLHSITSLTSILAPPPHSNTASSQ